MTGWSALHIALSLLSCSDGGKVVVEDFSTGGGQNKPQDQDTATSSSDTADSTQPDTGTTGPDTGTTEADTATSPDDTETAEDTELQPPEDSGSTDGCYTDAVTVVVYESLSEFETALGMALNKIDFDDVDTADAADPLAISADRYLASHGAIITGQDGQYVDEQFQWTDYASVSSPNMYAPGPAVLEAGGYRTDVTFEAGGSSGCVRGFGAMYIDADFPDLGESSLTVYNSSGSELLSESGFSTDSGSALFRGMVAFDADGAPQPAIGSVNLVNGSIWPMSSCCEGVTLDDFVFTPPE